MTWGQAADSVDADILLAGHTHLPFIVNAGTRKIVNPGSIGQPKHGAPEACYAVWEDGNLTLERRRYPVDETVRKVLALPVEARVRSALIDVLVQGGLRS